MDRFAKYIPDLPAYLPEFIVSAFVIGGLFALGCAQ